MSEQKEKLNISANLYRTNTAKWAGLLRVHSSVHNQCVSFLQECSLSPSPRILDRIPVFFGEIFSETWMCVSLQTLASLDLFQTSSRTVLILNWMTALGVLFEVAAVPFLPRRWTVSTVSRSRSTDSGTTCKYPDDNFSLLHPFRDRSASDSTFSCSRLAPHMSFLARCFLFEYHRVFFWSTAMSSSFCFDAVVLA